MPSTGGPSIADRCAEGPPAGLLAGIDLFNQRAFFACHEALEEIWLAERHPVRHLYQAILQVGVAFYHLERGNLPGARGLIAAGLDRLTTLPAVCQGVAVADLTQQTRLAQAALSALSPDRCHDFDPNLLPTVSLIAPPEGA